MNDKLKKLIWIMLLLIGLTPYIITGVVGIEAAINGENGFCADCPDEFGITAFINTFLSLIFIVWPIFFVGFVLIVWSILKLKNVDKNVIKVTMITIILILLIIVVVGIMYFN